jgi:hypothetical protein
MLETSFSKNRVILLSLRLLLIIIVFTVASNKNIPLDLAVVVRSFEHNFSMRIYQAKLYFFIINLHYINKSSTIQDL